MKGWLDAYEESPKILQESYNNIGVANSTIGLNTNESPAIINNLNKWLTTTPQGQEYFAMHDAGLNPKKQSIKQTLDDLDVSDYTKSEMVKRVTANKTNITDSTKLLKLINLNQLGGNPNYENIDKEWVHESPIAMADKSSKKIGAERGLTPIEIRKLRDQKFKEIQNSSYGKKFRTQGVSNREYFNPMLNEIGLHEQDSKRGAGLNKIPPDISEYSHAYRNKQEGSEIISGISSWIKHPYFTAKGQQETYNIPGQMEYDTHKAVAPILNDYFQGNIPIDKIKLAIDSKRKELSKLNSGGKMHEHQPNFNNSSVSIPKDFVGQGYNTKGRNWSPAWGGQFENGGSMPQDSIKESIFNKYPALKNLGDVTIKPDTTFTREKTGVGDIEYFSPEQDSIRYDNYTVGHPKLGTHGIIYNPKDNNEQSIMLDMLHGMKNSDSTYSKLRENVANAYKNSDFNNEFEHDYKTGAGDAGSKDGKDQAWSNWVDGQIRGLLFKGTPEEFEKSRYWPDARKTYLQDPKIKESFGKLENYINTGKSTMQMGGSMPGSVGFTYARTGSTPSEGKHAKKTMPSAQGGEQIQPQILQNFEEFRNSPEGKFQFENMERNRIAKKSSGRVDYSDIDPITDIALPLAGIAGTVGKQAIKQGAKKIGKYLTEETALKNTYKINPLAFKANPEAYYRMLGEKGYDDALQSGVIKSKKPHAYPEPYFGKGRILDGDYSTPGSGGRNPQTGEKYVSKGYGGPYMVESKAKMKGVGSTANDKDLMIATPNESLDMLNPNYTFYKQNWLQGYKEIPKQENGGEIPIAQNGQEMSFYQEGLDWLPRSMQLGGIVQDNNGYWNPDNWGNPVEIDSPYITMKGVNQPLLGVSDTGDKKMMLPGKDYKFKGKKVQEFPVSKNGNQLQKLDQLTNFNNFGQSSKWLEKYK